MKYDFPTRATRATGQRRQPLLTLEEAASRFGVTEAVLRGSFKSVQARNPAGLPRFQFDYKPRKYRASDLEDMLRFTGDLPCKSSPSTTPPEAGATT